MYCLNYWRVIVGIMSISISLRVNTNLCLTISVQFRIVSLSRFLSFYFLLFSSDCLYDEKSSSLSLSRIPLSTSCR